MLTLKEFCERFAKIILADWIKSHREGNTGIGKTLEDLLGINENNIKGPDFGNYELKSQRYKSSSLITLTTQKASYGDIEELREKIGYPQTKNGITINCLRQTMDIDKIYRNSFSQKDISFKLINNDRLELFHNNESLNIYWTIDDIVNTVKNKLSETLLVTAKHKHIRMPEGKYEYFKYLDAKMMKLKPNAKEILIQSIKDGTIKLDIRLGQWANGTKHDHGTGFRIKKSNLFMLFDIQEACPTKE